MNDAPAANRSITVSGTSTNSIITSGDGNTVIVYQTISTAAVSAAAPSDGKNPYVGLVAFTEADADHFFGRDALVAQLWSRFRELVTAPAKSGLTRFLAVLGPSGSGKSSVARAGLVAELARRPVGGRNARVVVLTPGAHPLDSLAAGLARVAGSEAAQLRKQKEFREALTPAGDDHEGLRHIAESLGAPASPLVLLVDQFEEIYSLCDDAEERKAFVAALLAAAWDRGGAVSVIITLRTDFLGGTQADSELNQTIARQSVIVPAMSPDELRSAIAEPAKLAGRPLHEATIARLITETEGRAGSLPLLQFVLVRIWEAGGDDEAELTKLGGVGGALGQEAERIFDELSQDQQVLAQRAFLAMVQFNENMRPTRDRAVLKALAVRAPGQDAAEALAQVEEVVGRFAQPDARLVTLSATPAGDQTAEVSHEAIFDNWPRLKTWLTEGADDLELHQKLRAATRDWDSNGRSDGLLWRSPLLEQGRTLAAKPTTTLTDEESAFLTASDRAATRLKRRSQQVLGAGILLTLFAAFLGAQAVLQDRRAQLQQSRAYAASAQQALAQGENARALLLALEATPPGTTDKRGYELASDVLRAALINNTEEHTIPSPRGVAGAAFADGDHRVVTAAVVGAQIWDPVRPGRPLMSSSDATAATVSPDGKWVATLDRGGVDVWNAHTGAHAQRIPGPSAKAAEFGLNNQLAISWADGQVGIWDSATGAVKALLAQPAQDKGQLNYLAFAPDGHVLAVVTEGRGIGLWNADSGALIRRIDQHIVFAFPAPPFFSRDGRYLAMESQFVDAGQDPSVPNIKVRAWDTVTGRRVADLNGGSPQFSHTRSGLLFLTTDDALGVVDLATGKRIDVALKGIAHVGRFQLAPDDSHFLSTSPEQTTFFVGDLDWPERAQRFVGHTGGVLGAVFSRDGSRVLSFGNEDRTARVWRTSPVNVQAGPAAPPDARSRRLLDQAGPWFAWHGLRSDVVYDLRDGRSLAEFPVLSHNSSIAISPNGRFIARSAGDTVSLLNLQTGKELILRERVEGLTFTPDSARLVLPGDGGVKLYDPRTGAADPRVLTSRGRVTAVAAAMDGRILVGDLAPGQQTDMTSALRVWTPRTGKVQTLQVMATPIKFAAFSHNGRLALAVLEDKHARIWDLDRGSVVTLPVDADRAAFSPDDKMVATTLDLSAENPEPTKFWATATGQKVLGLPEYDGGDWSPDGRFVGVNANGATAILNLGWASGAALREQACRRKPRDFTADEVRTYNLNSPDPCRRLSWLAATGLGR